MATPFYICEIASLLDFHLNLSILSIHAKSKEGLDSNVLKVSIPLILRFGPLESSPKAKLNSTSTHGRTISGDSGT